jgi:hypothetical protein
MRSRKSSFRTPLRWACSFYGKDSRAAPRPPTRTLRRLSVDTSPAQASLTAIVLCNYDTKDWWFFPEKGVAGAATRLVPVVLGEAPRRPRPATAMHRAGGAPCRHALTRMRRRWGAGKGCTSVPLSGACSDKACWRRGHLSPCANGACFSRCAARSLSAPSACVAASLAALRAAL